MAVCGRGVCLIDPYWVLHKHEYLFVASKRLFLHEHEYRFVAFTGLLVFFITTIWLFTANYSLGNNKVDCPAEPLVAPTSRLAVSTSCSCRCYGPTWWERFSSLQNHKASPTRCPVGFADGIIADNHHKLGMLDAMSVQVEYDDADYQVTPL